MRIQSQVKVIVRGRVLGGPRPLVCLPLVARDETELLRQAEEVARLTPDFLEWRADAFDQAGDVGRCLDVLAKLRVAIKDLPLILTCRADSEGGFQPLPLTTRVELLLRAMDSGGVDLVDLELASGSPVVAKVREAARGQGTKLILSAHDFQATPAEEVILRTLAQAQEQGADLAKVAVMPRDQEDVLRLLRASLKARREILSIPAATLAMGERGAVTRVVGGLFGSDLTFAVGQTASAPGQMPLAALRLALEVLYA